MNFKQIKAIEQSNKKRLLKVCPTLNENSGIYILTREENGFKYAYIGQAKHILTRLAQHLKGYQHIDLSIKKHGLFSNDNPTGWDIEAVNFDINELNDKEQYFIKKFANMGYQLRNKTTGSQGVGKAVLGEQKERKGYNQGLHKGYENAQKDVAKLFEKNLTYSINGKENKNKLKAYEKFEKFLKGEQSGL